MNHDKAREFFSAYYEGALDGGLRQSFEQKLRSDANLQADYAAFAETFTELNTLRDEEIVVPAFLSDRIASRLEQVQSKQKSGVPSWARWLGGFAFAGLAVVTVLLALPKIRGGSEFSQAGLTTTSSYDQIMFKVDGAKVVLAYQPSSPKTLVVSSPTTDKEIQRFSLNNQRLESPIENPLPKAAIFKIEALGDKGSSLLALPGKSPEMSKTGEGSVQDLALALAGHYRVPVEIEAADVTHRVTWSFASPDVRATASQALESEGFSVDQRPDGLLEIMDR